MAKTINLKQFLNQSISSERDVIEKILNNEQLHPFIGSSADKAKKILGHPNVYQFLKANPKLVQAFKTKFPVTEELLGGKKKKKIETVGCLDLEARIGEGGLGVVNLGSINESRVRGYEHLKLAEMWAQMTKSAGLYLALKANGNGNDEDEKTKRGRNRTIIEEVMQEHSKEELIDLILKETSGKKYAVKFCNLTSPKSYTASDIESVRRFRREFELTNSMNLTEDEEEGNKNVVRLLFEEEESCLDNPEGRDKSRSGRIYYVMELLEGGDLAGKLEDAPNGVLEIHEAIGIILEVADALAYAHANKIIHRDMKPENIMFTKDGEVRVTDFGLGKDTSDKNATNLSRTGYAMGTPTYMPLEQARDAKHVKPNADVYSIGMTLYKMVVGSMPFELDGCRTMQQIADKLIENEGREHEWLPFPDAQAGTQEEAFNKTILKAIQINPKLRYRRTEDFVADLEKVWAWDEMTKSEREIDVKDIEKSIREKQRQEWWNKRKLPVVGGAIAMGVGAAALAIYLIFGGGDPIGDALKQYETELTAIESLAKDGKLEDALRRAEALDKKINESIKTGGDAAKQRLSKVDGRVEAAVAKYEIQTIVDTYQKRFDSAARLEDPLNREEQIRSLIQELEDFNKKKDSTEIAKLITSKQTSLEDAVESRIEAEIKSAYAKAQEFEQQGLLVEAFYEYERVTSEWKQRETDLQKKKVGAVYTANELKHEEIARRIWNLEGKDPVWRTLQFCVEEAKKRGDYRAVNDDEYHTVAVLLAKKVVEPLAQGSIDEIPVAVQRDGTWWKERMENLTWETRRSPGDFVASIWECYQMFKGTPEEEKWLDYARKWMEIFKRINEDNIDAYTGKALLENHFVAMEIDPDPARREEYKQEIRRLCDLIVKKRWNEELGFLTHYVLDGDQDKRDRLYSAVVVDVLALYRAHNLFRNPEYKEKADKTLEKLLTHIKASQHPKDPQIYNFVGFEKNGNPMFFHYNLGCIEMYIQYATALIEIYNVSKNENCKNFARAIFDRTFDSVNFNEIPYYSLFSYIVSENSTNEIAQSYRKFGMKKSQRLLAETIFFAEKLKDMVSNRAKESGQARYTLVCTITTPKAWEGISNSDVANITEDVQNQQVAGIKDRGISSNVDTTHTTHIYELASYFKALRKNK